MTNNEVLLRRAAADLARSGEKITKTAIRKRIKGLKFTKDGNNCDGRVEIAYGFAIDFALIRSQRIIQNQLPNKKDRQSQLLAMKKKRFLDCVQRASFRQTKRGKHINFVQFVTDKDQVKALSWEGPGGIRASDKQIDSEHRFFIMKNWTTKIQNCGLAVLNGNLTLYIDEPKQISGIEVCAAIWASQDHGCTLKTNYGYIARNGEHSMHGNTEDSVIKNIVGHRKLQ